MTTIIFLNRTLVPITVEQRWINEIKASLPELPDSKESFVSDYVLPEYDADLLTEEKSTAEYFEEAVKLGGNPKIVANWIITNIFKHLKEEDKEITEILLPLNT